MSIPSNLPNFDVIDTEAIPPNYEVDTWVFNHVQSETMDVYLFSGTYCFIDNSYLINVTGTNFVVANYTGTNMYINSLTGASGAFTNLNVNNLYLPTLDPIDSKTALTYDLTTKEVGYYAYSLIPEGTILPYGGSSAPPGYLLCDGAAISRTTYARLFAVFGTTYGSGDGLTTFNIPNLQGKIPVGRDAGQTEFDTLGELGGAKTVTLTTGEIPAHTHSGTGTTTSAGSHSHTPAAGFNFVTTYSSGDDIDTGAGGGIASGNATQSSTSTEPAHTHDYSFTTSSTGGSGAHNNLQPYIVLNYIVRF
jgi:microcystin-dependent protein